MLDRNLQGFGGDSRYFARYKAVYIARCVTLPAQAAVLDWGCGVGLLADELASLRPGWRVDGFDTSAASIANVPPRLAGAGCFTSDRAAIPGRYDLVILSNVLHHVDPPARGKLLADLAGFLRPGGQVIVFEHNPLNPVTRWLVRTCPFDEGVHLLWPAEARRHLRGAGLAGVRRHFIVFLPPFLGLRWMAERVLRWLPLGAQYAAVARQPD